jgi:hypothetical protein
VRATRRIKGVLGHEVYNGGEETAYSRQQTRGRLKEKLAIPHTELRTGEAPSLGIVVTRPRVSLALTRALNIFALAVDSGSSAGVLHNSHAENTLIGLLLDQDLPSTSSLRPGCPTSLLFANGRSLAHVNHDVEHRTAFHIHRPSP